MVTRRHAGARVPFYSGSSELEPWQQTGARRCQSVARSAGGSGCRRVSTRNCRTRQIARIREIQGLDRVSGDLAGSLWLAGVAHPLATAVDLRV